MIQLTSRQQALLRFLAAMSGYVSVKDIANQFGYSQRTIRYDLDAVEVWLRDQGGALDKRPNAGVRLEAGAALRRRLEDTLAVGELEKVFSPEERMEAIYYRLLLGEGPVKAEDLAEGLGVSTPTVMRDIREMGQWMEDKQLTVASKKGEGYRLAGREQQLRSCLVQALAEGLGSRRALTRYSLTSRAVERLPWKGQSVAALAARYLSRVDMDALSHLLDYARETLYHTMPENDYIRLLLYLAVLCRRAGAGAVIPRMTPPPARAGRGSWPPSSPDAWGPGSRSSWGRGRRPTWPGGSSPATSSSHQRPTTSWRSSCPPSWTRCWRCSTPTPATTCRTFTGTS